MSTPAELEAIALKAARHAVTEFTEGPAFSRAVTQAINTAMEQYGINVDTPEAREKLRRDMLNLRTWTEFWDFAKKKGIGATITWVVTGGLALLVAGIFVSFHR